MSRKPRATPVAAHDHFAIEYLNVVLEEADQEELVAALSRIARTCGRSRVRLVEKIELNAQALYRALCLRGNPELKSATTLLRAMGIRLTVQPIAGSWPAHGNAGARAAFPLLGRKPPPIVAPTDLIWSAAGVSGRSARRNGALY